MRIGGRGKEFGVDLGEEAADGCRAVKQQDRDANEAVGMDEVTAQGLVGNLFLVAVPEEHLIAYLDKEPTALADEVQRGLGIQRSPLRVVGYVPHGMAREKLSRLGAGGSPVPKIEPHGLHHPPGTEQPSGEGPEGWDDRSKSVYRS